MIDELSKLKETLKRVNKIKVYTDLLDCIDIYEKQDDNTYIEKFIYSEGTGMEEFTFEILFNTIHSIITEEDYNVEIIESKFSLYIKREFINII